MTYTLEAPAKINFALDVLRKRPDGYHEVSMIMQTVALFDRITVCGRDGGIELTTDSPAIPADETNIAYKAAAYLRSKYHINKGASIHIEKRIPVAAGLAGGSTDAAAVLKLLNKLWELGLSHEELREAGARLGADVPFCIQGGTCLAEGLGEVLTPLANTPECWLLLVKPPLGVSTKEVYQSLKLDEIKERPDIKEMLQAIEGKNIKGICIHMRNVLETVTLKLHPMLSELKRRLLDHGAAGSLMSGSGPTVFGVFEDEAKAREAYEDMKNGVGEVFLVKTFNGREE
jgi:4-diphosphocytidyl-2-C-methyl-D-erythritol kinase